MAIYVRYNSCNISLPTSAKQQREMTKVCILLEREPRRLIFFYYYFKCLTLSKIHSRDSFDTEYQSK